MIKKIQLEMDTAVKKFPYKNLNLPTCPWQELTSLISSVTYPTKSCLLSNITPTMNLVNLHPLFLNVFFLFFIILFNNLHSSTSLVPGNETDRSALMSFKAELTSDPLQSLASWNESTHFCQWMGITCGEKHRRVIQIDMSSKQLTGPLSPSVGNLSFLRVFIIDKNNFAGEIPPAIGRLSKLRTLSMANNSFSGKIPSNISQCLNLERIDLGGNHLVGTIPIEFQSLSKMKVFYLYNNNITGAIPDSLGNFSALEIISLRFNNFEGNIPNTLGGLAALEHFLVGQNNLSGTIPPSFFNLSNLLAIHALFNEIEGTLPSDLWLKLPRLQALNFANNSLTGLIPKSISNASQLVFLDISINGFIGGVPDVKGLHRLELFSLHQNFLGSGDEGDLNFFSSLSNSTKLRALAFYQNNIGGNFPKSIGNLTELTFLSMYDNPIYGNIPNDIGELVKLESLGIDACKFTGSIPNSIGNLREFRQLSLEGNNLSGDIPPSLGNLTKLIALDIGNNNLQGSIPPSLANCVALSFLSLSQNNLSGHIPSEILSLPSLTMLIDLSSNRLVGPLILVEQVSRSLYRFSVSNNLLSGEIPRSFGGYQSLSYLSLAGNLFQGGIPPSLSSLRAIEFLDLSSNNLSGKIPEFMETFPFLTSLNLSFNDFEGAVPIGGVFRNTSGFSIDGNSKICGGVQELNLPKCAKKVGVSKKRRVSRDLKYIIPTCLGIPALILMLLAVFLYRRRHAKRIYAPDGLVRDTFPQVSYEDLHKATDGFSSTNLCGSGKFSSVYKGVLDENEAIVAVKVLKLEVGGAAKSFTAECEALRIIRHRNLVKIFSSCSTIDFQGNDFKALVYTFMVNGSLEGWLHQNPRSLTLLERLNIVIDVACALDYLHNHSGVSMVHCDIKPSNVLLDSDLVGHLGDFGLSKFLREATSSSSSTSNTSSLGIKGTVGYAAPEYGMGSEISTYGDVYSFGILILEIFSGKRPTDDMFNDGLNLHNFAKMAIPDRVMEISDSRPLAREEELQKKHGNYQFQNNLIYDRVSECLVSIFRIGVSCSVELPRERMDISDAIRQLHLIKKTIVESTIMNRGKGDR